MRPATGLSCGVVLACFSLLGSAAATQLPIEQEAAALFGLEYEAPGAGAPMLPGRSSCTDAGDTTLSADPNADPDADANAWSAGLADCRERRLALLKRRMGERDGRTLWRIEDVLLLPPLADAPGKRRLAQPDECMLEDNAGASFLAVLRERRRGDTRPPVVEQVWGYDLAQGRFQRLPQSRLGCGGGSGR